MKSEGQLLSPLMNFCGPPSQASYKLCDLLHTAWLTTGNFTYLRIVSIKLFNIDWYKTCVLTDQAYTGLDYRYLVFDDIQVFHIGCILRLIKPIEILLGLLEHMRGVFVPAKLVCQTSDGCNEEEDVAHYPHYIVFLCTLRFDCTSSANCPQIRLQTF